MIISIPRDINDKKKDNLLINLNPLIRVHKKSYFKIFTFFNSNFNSFNILTLKLSYFNFMIISIPRDINDKKKENLLIDLNPFILVSNKKLFKKFQVF